GNVEVFGVAKFSKQDRVNQLGNPLSYLAGVGFLRHFKENDLGGRLGVDEVKQVTDAAVPDLLLEEFSELASKHGAILKGVAEVLGKRAFTRTEKSRHPDAIVDPENWTTS